MNAEGSGRVQLLRTLRGRLIAGMLVILVAAMVALATINHVRLLPQLKAGGSADGLSRNIRRELLLGFMVVALAAVLGLIAPTM